LIECDDVRVRLKDTAIPLLSWELVGFSVFDGHCCEHAVFADVEHAIFPGEKVEVEDDIIDDGWFVEGAFKSFFCEGLFSIEWFESVFCSGSVDDDVEFLFGGRDDFDVSASKCCSGDGFIESFDFAALSEYEFVSAFLVVFEFCCLREFGVVRIDDCPVLDAHDVVDFYEVSEFCDFGRVQSSVLNGLVCGRWRICW